MSSRSLSSSCSLSPRRLCCTRLHVRPLAGAQWRPATGGAAAGTSRQRRFQGDAGSCSSAFCAWPSPSCTTSGRPAGLRL
jgi:hypothetical protein